jgi:hypothetical protein
MASEPGSLGGRRGEDSWHGMVRLWAWASSASGVGWCQESSSVREPVSRAAMVGSSVRLDPVADGGASRSMATSAT